VEHLVGEGKNALLCRKAQGGTLDCSGLLL
jgi:hypothetical protein